MEVACAKFEEAKVQKAEGQTWPVAIAKHQRRKHRRGVLLRLEVHKDSAEDRMCCPVDACAFLDVAEGPEAKADRNPGRRLYELHSDVCDGVPIPLERQLPKVHTEHRHHCCVASQGDVWGVAEREREPGTVASDTVEDH